MHEDNNEGVLSVVENVFAKNNCDVKRALIYGFAGGASYQLIEKSIDEKSKIKTYYISSYPYGMLQNICINFGIHHEIWNYKLIEINKKKIADRLALGECLFVNEVMPHIDMTENFCCKWGILHHFNADLLTADVRWTGREFDERLNLHSKEIAVHCLHFPQINKSYTNKLRKIIHSNSVRFLYQKDINWNLSGMNNLINNLTKGDIILERDFTMNDMNRKLYSRFISGMCEHLEDSFYEQISELYIKSGDIWKSFFLLDKECKVDCLNEIYYMEKKANEMLMEH